MFPFPEHTFTLDQGLSVTKASGQTDSQVLEIVLVSIPNRFLGGRG